MGRTGRRACGIALAGLAVASACTGSTTEPRAAITPLTSGRGPATATSAAPAPSTSVSSPAPATTSAASVSPRPHGSALPLAFRTGSARQVITVSARSTASTHATLQAWRKVTGGWARVGPAVPAWLGSDGATRHPSESLSATPIGSFTLTRAFGREPDPARTGFARTGTALPYRQTSPADWWISEPGPLYNTFQHCAGNCAFTQGDPNEHLYAIVPYYRYAAVIDYNTRNAPGGVRQGAGSAFFLHVSVGEPTQGCVSIAEGQLVRLLRWLTPAAHPRILIGLA